MKIYIAARRPPHALGTPMVSTIPQLLLTMYRLYPFAVIAVCGRRMRGGLSMLTSRATDKIKEPQRQKAHSVLPAHDLPYAILVQEADMYLFFWLKGYSPDGGRPFTVRTARVGVSFACHKGP